MNASWILVAALALPGCLSSKESSFYALSPKTGTAASGAPALVELRRPGVPGYLDRASIVRRVKNHQLRVDPLERWAEPLGDMIGRVLAQNLSSRLTGTQIFVENGAVSALPEAVVAVDVQQFDSADDGKLVLVAQVVIESPGTRQAARARRFELSGAPADNSIGAQASTMSDLLAQLADRIATMLRETPAPLPSAAPTHP